MNLGPAQTVTVEEGETFTKELSDGETWGNVLLDITQPDAAYEIRAEANDWAIRNVGVLGTYPDRNDGQVSPIRVSALEADATGRIDNVYLGDGGEGITFDDSSKATGIFVEADHAGHLDVSRVNVSAWPDNGIYASGPGNPPSHQWPGEGGTITIDTCYSERCYVSGFRLGTEGSSCVNCVTKNGYRRGFWAYYDDITFENCDAVDNDYGNFACNPDTTMRLRNCRVRGSPRIFSRGTVVGTLSSNPRTWPPRGVPVTARDAASGDGNRDRRG